MGIAIVTGASSGLGKEFVYQIASKEKNISEIWVIARREERLKELADSIHIPVQVLPIDLIKRENIDYFMQYLKTRNPQVNVLVNAAGFGRIGSYKDINLLDSDNMIDLNCRAAVDMTVAVLPYMKRKSRILEICSTSAFQPFQYLNVYAATKAFLYRYSRALRIELLPRGIHVTAVCPYWIRDTEFISKAKHSKDGKEIKNFIFASKVKNVVSMALADSRIGLPVSTPGPICFVHRIVAKFIPHEIMMWLWELIRRL
ncbi:SDR family NAD(P)-dependent oxidoreductase [Clostridium luticellarii]|jgi:short-subunit dehydrogenase|uniref:NADP-dependent 3-hydroxy acid dehydrogenase YdfG n=1 Tax=Clostridium luticellarii TaxID=1691940 RepID=A0A2T0BNA2_9CLOT|nr:SDR family NAD(P)-dependent oxidoreductase [Clostridium luticellarii]MCI1945427.1 SDR family NAD(P)-dependent oxidoreductase [Clostridium luticellarii]MCI1968760.1 SDR family NAD(P)-dependent oxidoreductase [Clostridium luticellarii]MCI1994966.1 SDR family NAD(P)-dependent oxidoreductase [Clostridium luticellarii]MCI2040187.1 SDR family NAD(P)-dependent oxidoreductase [Clostridium luticellarii]PRR85351.1 NADP-dependent 3-hydroxy acid dehydrogenase YdfG [Clostridium luticellarii]